MFGLFSKKKEPPTKVRQCRVCGGIGHDARNCPSKNSKTPHDTTLWIKYDKITDDQADKMVSWNKKGKKKYLDESARATALKTKDKGLSDVLKRNLFGGD